jgi:hypothetical protein
MLSLRLVFERRQPTLSAFPLKRTAARYRTSEADAATTV